MTNTVLYIALRGKYVMFAAAWLHPLQVDQLRHKELRQRLLNLITGVDGKHSKRARRAVAARLHLQRQIVEKVNAFSS